MANTTKPNPNTTDIAIVVELFVGVSFADSGINGTGCVERFESFWGLAAGYVRDSFDRDGVYGRISVLIRR